MHGAEANGDEGQAPVHSGAVGPLDHASPEAAGGFKSTGSATVDDVVRSVVEMQRSPVHEHVTHFEHAHESLRAILNDAERQ